MMRAIEALVQAGLTRGAAERAAGANITDRLTGRGPRPGLSIRTRHAARA
jgi:hypothetical protein